MSEQNKEGVPAWANSLTEKMEELLQKLTPAVENPVETVETVKVPEPPVPEEPEEIEPEELEQQEPEKKKRNLFRWLW